MRGGVFVCHASKDAGVAQRVVVALEAAGVPCWIAPRDIEPGESYSRAILDGLEGAPALVLVFSAATNDSPHVTRELESAVSSGIPIVPVRLEPVEPSRELRYFIGTSQWLDTSGEAAEQWEPPLVGAVRRAVGQTRLRPRPAAVQPAPLEPSGSGPRRRAPWWPWAVVGAALVAATVAVVVLVIDRGDDQPPADSPAAHLDPSSVPTGHAGMATVFPSLSDDCDSVQPALDAKSEVYVCRTERYLVRYSRWEDDFDRGGFLDSFTGVESTPWTVDGVDVGEQWTYQSVGDPNPYRWTATYTDLPFSVDVEAVSAKDRGVGIAVVVPSAPDSSP